MHLLNELAFRYKGRTSVQARQATNSVHAHYLERARKFGFVARVGAASTTGLASLLLVCRTESGTIDPSKLPEDLLEAFELQYPNLHQAGRLSELTPESAQSLLNGWTGKYVEILVRNSLNSGDCVGGVSLAAGEVAVLAESPNQELWDLRIEPSGRLLQVKATDDLAYVKETLRELQGSDVDVVVTGHFEIDETSAPALIEFALAKDEVDNLVQGALADSVDDLDIDDFVGSFGLVLTAGSILWLVRAIWNGLNQGKSITALSREYGPRAVGKAINLVSPIPGVGFGVSRILKRQMIRSEVARIVKQRIRRADQLLVRREKRNGFVGIC